MSTFLNTTIIIAIFAGLAATVGLIYYGRRWLQTEDGKKFVARATGMKVVEIDETEMLPTDHLPSTASPEERLKLVEDGQVIEFVDDLGASDHQVRANMTLQPMTQELFGRRRWVPKEELSSQAILVGGEWIFRVPSSEGGRHVWMRGTLIPTPSLAMFYKGTDARPGPAREFNLAKQDLHSPEIIYQLPSQLTPKTEWRIHDLGAFEISVQGDTDNLAHDGDFVFFVTSKQVAGDDWLFFLDARDRAVGTGGLFQCEPFNPSEEIRRLF